MATPLIAASAALVRQYFLAGFYPGGAPDPGSGFAPSGPLVKVSPAITPWVSRCHASSGRSVRKALCASIPKTMSPLAQCISWRCDVVSVAQAWADEQVGEGMLWCPVQAVLIGGASGLEGFESDTGLPLAPPPSFRQGFGRVHLGASLPLQVLL